MENEGPAIRAASWTASLKDVEFLFSVLSVFLRIKV